MPVSGDPPPPSSRPYSGLLGALHHCISGGDASSAVSLLPTLACAGLRAPFPLLSSLARLLLLRRGAPSFPSLAGKLLLYIRLAGLKRLVASSTQLADHLLPLHFLVGRPSDARWLFGRMPRPSLHSYNAMLAGYAHHDLADPAAEIFATMPHRDLLSYNAAMLAFARGGEARRAVATYSELRNKSPSLRYNHHTFLALLVACTELMDRDLVWQVHAHLAACGFLSDVNIAGFLLEAYRKCGWADDAGRLFDEITVKDVQIWTTIVCAFAEDGQLDVARRLFDQMPERNVVSWNALSEGYVRGGRPLEALSMFRLLKMEDLGPDQFTFASCLSACAAIGSLKQGQQIHGMLQRAGFDQNVTIISSLIDMYSKCGYMDGAKQVFSLTDRNGAVLWNKMLSALCHHSHAQEAIELFGQMNHERKKPDSDTFLLVLTACCHCRLVEEGMKFFDSMTEKFKIVPGEQHYICMANLVSQASSNDKVLQWIESSPFGFNKGVWEILVRSCTIHGNEELLSKLEEHLSECGGLRISSR